MKSFGLRKSIQKEEGKGDFERIMVDDEARTETKSR